MARYFKVEIIKLRFLKIWWLVIAGAVLPGIITYLTLFQQENGTWLIFTNTCLLTFNVQSLLTYSAFATYIWAREYEDHTMELVLCYPYPRFSLVLIKLVIMFLVIIVTEVLFFGSTLLAGKIMIESMIPEELFTKFIIVLLHTGIMNFLLLPIYFCIAIVTKISISGLIFGIINMCVCMAMNTTGFVQYIPQCIPYVTGDNLMGVKSITVDNSLAFYYGILIAIFLILLFISKKLESRF